MTRKQWRTVAPEEYFDSIWPFSVKTTKALIVVVYAFALAALWLVVSR